MIRPHVLIVSIGLLFFPMLDATIKGTVLLLVAGAVCLALRRDSAATRHLVWATAVLLLLAMPLLSILLPHWRVLPSWLQAGLGVERTRHSSPELVTRARHTAEVPRPFPFPADHAGDPKQGVQPPSAVLPKSEVPPALTDETDVSTGPALLAAMADQPVSLLTIAWLVGCGLVLLRLVIAALVLRKSASRCRVLAPLPEGGAAHPSDSPSGDRTLLAAMEAAALRLGMKRSVQLLLDPRPSIPVVWGLLRPRLRLPAEAAIWSVEQQQSVLLHELAHIRRHDLVVLTMTQFAFALNWFNPLMWLAAWRLHVEREYACDDLVLGAGVRPSAYAGNLVELVSRLRPAGWTRTCGLAMARKSSLECRLAAVLSGHINRRGLTRLLITAVPVVGALIAIPVAMLHATDPTPNAVPVAGADNPDKAAPAPQRGTKLDAGIEEKFQWGKPANGLCAALVRPQAFGAPAAGENFDFKLVVQNVSTAAVRLNTASAPKSPDLMIGKDGEILAAFGDSKPTRADVLLQPREAAVLRLFSTRTEGQSITADDPAMTFTAELAVENAPAGSWTGKLVTADTVGLFSAYGLMPKHKDARALFTAWNDSARGDEMIPGALIGQLAESVTALMKLNPTWDKTAALSKILPRFEATHDWSGPDAVALLDELAAITDIPIRKALDNGMKTVIGKGVQLPPELANAPWGKALPNGLRLAWLLVPRAAAHPLGTPLASRVLIHNAGKSAVVFRTETWHQGMHAAIDAKGAEINVESNQPLTIPPLLPFRLAPGEFIELNATGVGVGPERDDEDWHEGGVNSSIEAKAGDEVTLTTGPVRLSDATDISEPGHAPRWWLDLIKARLARRAPLPADAEERTRLLYRLALELFGTPVDEEETAAFVADRDAGALDSLAKRLARRTEVAPFTGSLQSGPTKFRVLPADPDAAKRPRTVSNPGWYRLGDTTFLSVSRRLVGERIVNEASLQFFSRDPAQSAPGEPHEIQLPDGYDTWAAAWPRGGTVLWVQEKGGIRRYDFSTPAKVVEEATPPEKVPVEIREALRRALPNPAPKPPPKGGPPPAATRP